MESQQFYHLFFTLTWIFPFSSISSGNDVPKIYVDNTVFVAFKGEDLTIGYELKKPANQTQDILRCFDPSNNLVYSCDISGTADAGADVSQNFVLKNAMSSGEYNCQYKRAKAFWFLRVRDHGYDGMVEYRDFIIVAITGVLLVFSVVGSVYVFRGHWRCGNAGNERTQSREDGKGESEEDKTNEVSSPSTSFYASLDARPRSIYDVLDRSAANTQPDQREAKPTKKKTPKPTEQTTQNQDEGIFESVYENF